MASLARDKHGYRLNFSVPGQPRKFVRLSQLGDDAAERALYHVEVALRAHRLRQPIAVKTLDWLYHSAPRGVLSALAQVGVVDDRRLLGDALRAWASSKCGKVGVDRIEQIERVSESLRKILGDVELESITPGKLQSWSEHVGASHTDNTTAGQCAIVRQFFSWAVSERLLVATPAGELDSSFARSERLTEVPAELVTQLCTAATTHGDRELMLALRLARWGGLRAGEILRVRHCDIDVAARALTVRDTKRAKHGHGTRIVPLFPELIPLLPVYDATAWPGVLSHGDNLLLPQVGNLTRAAVDQRAKRLCRQIGIQPWERFWQNMRATRESELMDAFSLKDACKWIGNSPEIAMKHYALVRNSEFDRAVGRAA